MYPGPKKVNLSTYSRVSISQRLKVTYSATKEKMDSYDLSPKGILNHNPKGTLKNGPILGSLI